MLSIYLEPYKNMQPLASLLGWDHWKQMQEPNNSCSLTDLVNTFLYRTANSRSPNSQVKFVSIINILTVSLRCNTNGNKQSIVYNLILINECKAFGLLHVHY